MPAIIPTLDFKIGIVGFEQTACVALPMHTGTNFRWVPNDGWLHLSNTHVGVMDPGGPPGHMTYDVYAVKLADNAIKGVGGFGLAEGGKGPITQVAHIEADLLLQK
ncbi:MAG TPA: hypothetical protein VGK74_04050 [Symbiobacteriaceae bacterium]|jgi:hypothetical protein